MALHAPTIHPPAAIHVPGWLQVAALALLAVLVLGVLMILAPQSEPVTTGNQDAYQQYRAEERSFVSDYAVQDAYQNYRAGEREFVLP